MVLVLQTNDLNKKIRAQIVNFLRNSRADPKNGVSYKKKRVPRFDQSEDIYKRIISLNFTGISLNKLLFFVDLKAPLHVTNVMGY